MSDGESSSDYDNIEESGEDSSSEFSSDDDEFLDSDDDDDGFQPDASGWVKTTGEDGEPLDPPRNSFPFTGYSGIHFHRLNFKGHKDLSICDFSTKTLYKVFSYISHAKKPIK